MLEYLRIRDLALIENMELDFAPGLNVLTGETGAGKSFILKALGFLLGDRLSHDMVRPGAERAQVEGVFTLGTEEYIVRRDIVASTGRSRLFMNDTLTSQDAVKDLRSRAVLHTSQHAQQKLLQPAWQAALLENALPSPHMHEQRDALLKKLHEIKAERSTLEKKIQHLSDRRDVLELQQTRINAVNPQPGEEDALEAQRATAKAGAQHNALREHGLALLHGTGGTGGKGSEGGGLLDLTVRLERLLEHIADESLEPHREAVATLRHLLPELERALRRQPEQNINIDALESRLYALAQLKRALRRPLDDIVLLREEITANLSFLDSCGIDLARLQKEEEAVAVRLRATLDQLIPARRAVAVDMTRALEAELTSLGFSPQARVLADFSPVAIWPEVYDEKARLLFAPNPGQTPQPLDRIASGGELSRFLLAVVGVQPGEEYATYIFDEVDAGVGGVTLRHVAERLHCFAAHRQILLITHWPQLAVHATRHFHVSKVERGAETFTLCAPLNTEQRHAELARMAGGGPEGIALATSLIDIS